jgi:ubiquinone/menaquinone biosynthesis C-methylase UbiE
MQKGEKLLEIGCGRGEFLLAFQGMGLHCQGVDLSDYCLKNVNDLNVSCVDISKEALPFADNSFDYVYHKSLIEHLYSPDNLMKETIRVLRPGGKIVILTPDWVSQMKVFYEDFTHSRPYDVTSLSDVLKVYGFSDVAAQKFYQLPIIWEHPSLKIISRFLQIFISVPLGRTLTLYTGSKFFRWSVELMIMATGTKKTNHE